jgi:poly(3-hydroxybutyrate) depolymerase
MKKTAAGILVLLLLLFCNSAYSEIDSNYSMEQMCIEINGHELSFWLYTPSDIGSNTALIVYLHGPADLRHSLLRTVAFHPRAVVLHATGTEYRQYAEYQQHRKQFRHPLPDGFSALFHNPSPRIELE